MQLSKEQLVIEQSKQDPEYFGIIFDEYYARIQTYCLRRVGDVAISQDIAAETFMKALLNIHSFTWKEVSISSWLYKIATNEVRMYFRRTKNNTISLEELYERDGFEPMSDQDVHQELVDGQDRQARQVTFAKAHQLLIKLPMKYQEVIVLRFVEKKKISEIAIIMGKKEGTVKSLLSRALARLRIQMNTTEVQPFPASSIVDSEGELQIIPRGSHEV
jgi:RNA polymerase sigma-70 factor (ECF subfamily)